MEKSSTVKFWRTKKLESYNFDRKKKSNVFSNYVWNFSPISPASSPGAGGAVGVSGLVEDVAILPAYKLNPWRTFRTFEELRLASRYLTANLANWGHRYWWATSRVARAVLTDWKFTGSSLRYLWNND